VILAIDRIRLLPEVEEVETMVAQTEDGWLGGGTTPVVTVVKEISVFPEEVAMFSSIVAGDTTRLS
jgi:hypothetical protein